MPSPSRFFLNYSVFLLALLSGTGACSKGTTPGGDTFDAGPLPFDAGAPVGSHDTGIRVDAAEECVVRCGPSATCCGSGEECVADRCLPRCTENRCGEHDELCCAAGQLCVAGACVARGSVCASSAACAEGQTCDPVERVCVPVPRDTACNFVPPSGDFAPVLQWEWTDEEVFGNPVVVQLNDDNGDGHVDARDVPDVVASAKRAPMGTAVRTRLVALSGDDGHVLWRSPDDVGVCWYTSPAAADVDHDGAAEIFTLIGDTIPDSGHDAQCGRHRLMAAFESDGSLKWRARVSISDVNVLDDAPGIADLYGDGTPDVLFNGQAYDAQTGELEWDTRRGTSAYHFFGMDLDGDGVQEAVSGNAIYGADGRIVWLGPPNRGFGAIGNVAGDSGPELLRFREAQATAYDAVTRDVRVGPLALEAAGLWAFSGPPAIADFDGDGHAEVGATYARKYGVFDFFDGRPEDNYVVWEVPLGDAGLASSGSTVFDFDADGAVEVLYTTECHLVIRSGRDGHLLFSTENTSFNYLSYPVVADVDGDGNAEIVVGSGDADLGSCRARELPYRRATTTRGIRVFRDRLDHWVPTRAVWNQFNYSIDAVNDDGSLPAHPRRGWDSDNTFRVNRLLDHDAIFFAPDLLVTTLDANTTACTAQITLRARVRNAGSSGVPRGLPVAFYSGTGELLGVAHTTEAILGGDSAWAELEVASPHVAADATFAFYAVADDDGTHDASRPSGEHSECHEDNNRSATAVAICRDPI